jgi:hypothetical protein
MIEFKDLTHYDKELINSIIDRFTERTVYVDFVQKLNQKIHEDCLVLKREVNMHGDSVMFVQDFFVNRVIDFFVDNEFIEKRMTGAEYDRLPKGDKLRRAGSIEKYIDKEIVVNMLQPSTLKNQNSKQIRKIKLFLASSNELQDEREKIEIAISRKNRSLLQRGFLIELSIWEDAINIGSSLRSQDNYNLEVEKCDLFVMLFYSKVGKYSLEEFKLAKNIFEKEKRPRIQIFQKNIDLPKNQSREDSHSRFNFLELLKIMELHPSEFDNADKLTKELCDNIDKLLDDDNFTKRLTYAISNKENQ